LILGVAVKGQIDAVVDAGIVDLGEAWDGRMPGGGVGTGEIAGGRGLRADTAQGGSGVSADHVEAEDSTGGTAVGGGDLAEIESGALVAEEEVVAGAVGDELSLRQVGNLPHVLLESQDLAAEDGRGGRNSTDCGRQTSGRRGANVGRM